MAETNSRQRRPDFDDEIGAFFVHKESPQQNSFYPFQWGNT